MTAEGRAAEPAPSAELLLYLAEFADDQGRPEDPIEVAAQDDESPNPKTRNDPEAQTHEPPSRPQRVESDD